MSQYMPKCYNCQTYNLPYECDSVMHYGLRCLRPAPGLLPTHNVCPGLLVSPDIGWRGEAHPGGLGDGAEDAALRPDQLQTLALTVGRYSLNIFGQCSDND